MKLFIRESGTQEMIDRYTGSEDRTLVVSVLAAIEVRSAIRRRQMAGDLDAADSVLAIETLKQETGRILEHSISAPVISEATGLVDRHGLRALDSIQLASAIVARSRLTMGDAMVFAASDERLLRAAQKEGFDVWNPAPAAS